MKEIIIAIIAEKGGLISEVIKDKDTWNELGFDSLDLVELIMAFETEFKILIPDYDMDKITTVGDAVKYIEGKMA